MEIGGTERTGLGVGELRNQGSGCERDHSKEVPPRSPW